MYGWGRYAGFGTLDYYGLLAQANLENCSPMDSACVSNNVAKQAAVEDLWVNKYMKTGAPDDLQLTFTPQTQGQVNEFYDSSFQAGNVVDTRGILSYDTASSDPVRYVPPSEPSFKAALPVAPVKTVNPAGKSVINSSGPSVASAFTEVFQPGGAASSVPWWGWLLGAGVGLYALKGAK